MSVYVPIQPNTAQYFKVLFRAIAEVYFVL